MTDEINDVRHTSTYAKAEDAIRRDERSRISPEIETVTNRQLHDVIANAISKGRTYSGIQEAVREIQKLYAGHAQTPAAIHRIEHDGFEGVEIGSYTTLEGKQGVVLQQVGTRVVHVYGRKWLSDTSTDRALGRNWVEDATHENGNYECRCVECGNSFIGHKRRVLCKLCSVDDRVECAYIRLRGATERMLMVLRYRNDHLYATGMEAVERAWAEYRDLVGRSSPADREGK